MKAANAAELSRRIARGAKPVRPLPSPWLRAAIWCALSLPVIAVIAAAAIAVGHDEYHPNIRLMIEQAAALGTGVVAAAVAFATTVPGYPRRMVFLPLLPFAVWAANITAWCVGEHAFHAGILWTAHWACLPITVLVGAVPAAILLTMLRRGAPLAPHLTTFLAALAVAGLANFGVRFVHASDASLVVLAWHFAAVLMLSALLPLAGRHLFNWQQLAA
jgi:hypothetical protein